MIEIDIYNVHCIAYGVANYPEVHECLDAMAPGHQYTYLYKSGRWDGKVNLLKDETFPTGLLPVVWNKIIELGIPHRVEDRRFMRQLYLQQSPVTLRPYQQEAVDACLSNTLGGAWWPRGVIQVATGGGKTEIAADIISKTKVPTLFLVHRQDLQSQAIERFNLYGIAVGDLDAIGTVDVVVTTIQSLMSWNMSFEKHYTNAEGEKVTREDWWMVEKAEKQAARSKFIRDELDKIEQVFVDEAHLVAAKMDNMNMFSTALGLMPNAYMRWGLTATPFMRDKLHNWMLEGATGSTLYQITNRELIDMGYLTEAFVDMYIMPQNADIPRDWPRCYEYGIMTNKKRNDQIVRCFSAYPGPTLILVNKIGHGHILEKKLSEAGFNVPFVSGSSTKAERKKAIEDLKSGKLRGVIASTIWDEGIDIANIGTVILAGAGKSEIKNLQRLGRGLRRAEGKQELKLVDFLDPSPNVLKKHSKIREELWKDQGFTINYIR